jgi:hypothetical protein
MFWVLAWAGTVAISSSSSSKEREKFLYGEAPRRWQTLHTIVETYAHPWFERYEGAEVNEKWYKDYLTR